MNGRGAEGPKRWPPVKNLPELAERTNTALHLMWQLLNGRPEEDPDEVEETDQDVGVLVFSLLFKEDASDGKSPACLLHSFADERMLLAALKQMVFQIEERMKATTGETGHG